MFFDKREFRIRLAKTDNTENESFETDLTPVVTESTANIISGLVEDVTKTVIVGIAALIIAVKVVDVICTIAEKRTPAA